MKKDKALVFTVFNRKDYLIRTLDAWSKVKNLGDYDIFFKIEPTKITRTMVKIIKQFENKVESNVHVIVNETVQGVHLNTWSVFDLAFEKYNFVIYSDDDMIPSQDVADYFTELEKMYRDDPQVLFICAGSERDGFNPEFVSRVQSFPGRLIATWRDKWHQYVRNTWDFDYSTAGPEGLSGWDWNVGLRVMPQNNLFSIIPHHTRCQHIGEVGIHCSPTDFHESQYKSFKDNCEWDKLIEV
jgi:hypothetical protein